jgi:hypothetical protein
MDNINKTKIVKTDAEGKPLAKAKPQTLWVWKSTWQKLRIIKKDIGGSWNRLIEIVCEQLLASGLVSAEAREEVREITRNSGTDLMDDSYWRNTFRIGEPWPEVAATQKQIAEELAKINANINQLVEAVEDHAIAMLSIDHVQPEELEDEI